ncbi:hypothetical protein DVI44_003008 [Escherichia coli]|uniref:Uncharacterized protein n=2 Tax=Escherichia coli O157:H7 TaxID=83334 RepID=A0A0H3JFY9_ECO57|nr:hypothetical protein [Escherichia coli]YP_009502613.1 hypothetical protein ECs_5716 [Escherichia coli O157:H7 str. Sakai]AAG56055.1 hypothetical protein Z1967 [Escherichia coli O157:H7 str. EDL933]ADD56053.1 hypothetical protein G2583_1465 [Escherichia coli O55:H7 str. CB9615]AFJ28685.1 hypothetical protein CDCO157_1629 [Escherichia coli Xuzhou21]ASE50053.1 hypothetical protein CEP72_24890 [Escherichia coli O157]EEQ2107703.1 hypothetical protein [Escherichia coli O157:H7]EET3377599.1 hypo
MCIKLALLFFRHEMPPILRSMLLFSYIREDFNFILFYQFVNQYTSIYIFRHSAILPDNFLVEQSVI